MEGNDRFDGHGLYTTEIWPVRTSTVKGKTRILDERPTTIDKSGAYLGSRLTCEGVGQLMTTLSFPKDHRYAPLHCIVSEATCIGLCARSDSISTKHRCLQVTENSAGEVKPSHHKSLESIESWMVAANGNNVRPEDPDEYDEKCPFWESHWWVDISSACIKGTGDQNDHCTQTDGQLNVIEGGDASTGGEPNLRINVRHDIVESEGEIPSWVDSRFYSNLSCESPASTGRGANFKIGRRPCGRNQKIAKAKRGSDDEEDLDYRPG